MISIFVTIKRNNLRCKILLVLLLVLAGTSNIYSETFVLSDSSTVEGEIIYSSNSSKIIEASSGKQAPVYFVLAEIANSFLPDIARAICLIVVGRENQEICDVIAEAIDFITSLRGAGSNFYKLSKCAATLSAERNGSKALFKFTATSLELANDIKNTVEAYQKLSLILWTPSYNFHASDGNGQYEKLRLENHSNLDATMQVSRDGLNWTNLTVPQKQSRVLGFSFPNSTDNYIFVKGLSCNYQIYTNQTYKIQYSNNLFYLGLWKH